MDHPSQAHAALGWVLFDGLVVFALAVAAIGYAVAASSARRRGPWPAMRTASWYAGLACAGLALLGPPSGGAHTSFTAHMAGHLLLGMVAPLLMVLASPVRLLMRALPGRRARAVGRLLRTPWVQVATHPAVAGLLNAGGLWLLYTTTLYAQMHGSPLVYGLVHTHVFLAGYVFTASVIGVDPDPHRASFRTRSVVLVAFIAAHSILAKWLYAHPPAGVEPRDAEVGAQLMYYGGDIVDVTLIVLLFLGRYRVTRPRERVSAGSGPLPAMSPARG